jgi:hypothetical protein
MAAIFSFDILTKRHPHKKTADNAENADNLECHQQPLSPHFPSGAWLIIPTSDLNGVAQARVVAVAIGVRLFS